VPVLHDISLSIEEGEYVAIMGPSGSGKSTLMNIIGCLDKPTSGSYILDGTEVANMKDKELSKVRNKSIGFVFQNFNLLPRQSALQNVELPLQYAKVPRRERRPKCVDALTSVDLQDRMSFKPTQLSGGQKQRVAIARAMVNSPKILLADEPTGALDSKSGIQVMGLFEKLHNEGVTIIMITHAREIAEYADRIITIFDGRITKDEKNLNKVVADYKTDENTAAAGGSDAKTPEGTAGITEENVSAAAEAALYDEGVSEEASFSNASDRLMSILNEESEGDEE
jgi:putative ABC transport system ATP-binding protein